MIKYIKSMLSGFSDSSVILTWAFSLFTICLVYLELSYTNEFLNLSQAIDYSWYYWLSVVPLLCLGCVYSIRKVQKHDFVFSNKLELLFFVCLCLFSIFLRYIRLHEVSIWFDEEIQILPLESNAFYLATSQNQPPLDYYLSKFIGSIAGLGETQVRFFAFIAAVLATPLVFVINKKLNLSRMSSFLILMSFLCNPWLIRYSREGRPISLVVFAFLIFLLALIDFIKSDKNKFRLFYLIAAQFFLLVSIGMQPLIVLGACLVLWLVLGILRPKSKSIYKKLAFSTFVSILISLPVLMASVVFSAQTSKIKSFNYEELIHKAVNLSFFSRIEWLLEMVPFWYLGISLYILLLVLFIANRFMEKKFFNKIDTQRLLPLMLAGAAMLLMATFCILVFDLMVNWDFFRRYLILLIPITIFLYGLCFEFVWNKYKTKLKLPILIQNFKYQLMIVLMTLASVASTQKYNYAYLDSYNPDNRGMFKFLKKNALPNSILLPFRMNDVFGWDGPKGIAGAIFYYHQKHPNDLFVPHLKINGPNGETQSELLLDALKSKKYDTVYVSSNATYELRIDFELRKLSIAPPLHGIYLLKFGPSKDLLSSAFDQFVKVSDASIGSKHSLKVNTLLALISIEKKDIEGVKKFIERVRLATDVPIQKRESIIDYILLKTKKDH